jgi:hypothetical protein
LLAPESEEVEFETLEAEVPTAPLPRAVPPVALSAGIADPALKATTPAPTTAVVTATA